MTPTVIRQALSHLVCAPLHVSHTTRFIVFSSVKEGEADFGRIIFKGG